jgi:hypothetical protein
MTQQNGSTTQTRELKPKTKADWDAAKPALYVAAKGHWFELDALFAERDAMIDEAQRLREALEPFTNNGRCFIFHRNVEEGDYFECLFCHGEGKRWHAVEHTKACLIAIARAALQPKAEQEQEK